MPAHQRAKHDKKTQNKTDGSEKNMVLTGPACFDIVSSFRRTYRSFQDL